MTEHTLTEESAQRIVDLKAKLTASSSAIERIALYNDPANGTLAERVVAMVEWDAETPR